MHGCLQTEAALNGLEVFLHTFKFLQEFLLITEQPRAFLLPAENMFVNKTFRLEVETK
jgi:hypothetical protein